MREVIIYKGKSKEGDENHVYIGIENDSMWIDATRTALRMRPDKITLMPMRHEESKRNER